jgi:hypothetical protein
LAVEVGVEDLYLVIVIMIRLNSIMSAADFFVGFEREMIFECC